MGNKYTFWSGGARLEFELLEGPIEDILKEVKALKSFIQMLDAEIGASEDLLAFMEQGSLHLIILSEEIKNSKNPESETKRRLRLEIQDNKRLRKVLSDRLLRVLKSDLKTWPKTPRRSKALPLYL